MAEMKFTIEMPMLGPRKETSYSAHLPLRIEVELKEKIQKAKAQYGKQFLEGMRVIIRQYVSTVEQGLSAHE